MNNAFQNALNPGKYHIRVFQKGGELTSFWNASVNALEAELIIQDGTSSLITGFLYDDICRIEIHACQFPYKENTPFLYIYLK